MMAKAQAIYVCSSGTDNVFQLGINIQSVRQGGVHAKEE